MGNNHSTELGHRDKPKRSQQRLGREKALVLADLGQEIGPTQKEETKRWMQAGDAGTLERATTQAAAKLEGKRREEKRTVSDGPRRACCLRLLVKGTSPRGEGRKGEEWGAGPLELRVRPWPVPRLVRRKTKQIGPRVSPFWARLALFFILLFFCYFVDQTRENWTVVLIS